MVPIIMAWFNKLLKIYAKRKDRGYSKTERCFWFKNKKL